MTATQQSEPSYNNAHTGFYTKCLPLLSTAKETTPMDSMLDISNM